MLSHQISRQSVNEKGDVESTLSVVVEKANRMHEYVNDNETQIRVNRSDLVSRFYLVPLPYRSSWGFVHNAQTWEHLSKIVHTSPKMSYVGLLISATILRLEHHFRHNVRPETSALMHVV